MTFATDLMLVDVLPDGRYRLAADLVYHGRDETFTVPEGTITDFASVPRFLSALVPIAGRYDRASVLHDFLCDDLAKTWRASQPGEAKFRAGGVGVIYEPLASAVDVDGIFRRVLREVQTPLVLRWLLWTGVRLGALANPARRAGWLRTAPQVAGISLLALPFVAPVAVVTAVALAVGGVLEGVARLIGRKK